MDDAEAAYHGWTGDMKVAEHWMKRDVNLKSLQGKNELLTNCKGFKYIALSAKGVKKRVKSDYTLIDE